MAAKEIISILFMALVLTTGAIIKSIKKNKKEEIKKW